MSAQIAVIAQKITPEQALDDIVEFYAAGVTPDAIYKYLVERKVNYVDVMIGLTLTEHFELAWVLRQCHEPDKYGANSGGLEPRKPIVQPDVHKTAARVSTLIVDDNHRATEFVKSNQSNLAKYRDHKDFYELIRRTAWQEDYSLADFEHDYRTKIEERRFRSSDEAHEWIKPRVLRFVRVFYLDGVRHVLIKITHDSVPLMKHTVFKRQFSRSNNYSLFFSTGSFDYFITMSIDHDFEYSRYDCVPFTRWEDPGIPINPNSIGTFNGFRHYAAKGFAQVDVDLDIISPLLLYIENVWANGDDASYCWIMSWLSYLVKYPRERLPMLVLVGNNNISPFVLDFLFEFVFGVWNTVQVGDVNSLLRKCNDYLEGKSLVYIENFMCNGNKIVKLKPLILGKTIKISQKNIGERTMFNASHYIALASSEIQLGFDRNTYYCNVFKTSSTDKFDDIHESFNQDVADHFYSFLYHLDQTQLPDPTQDISRKIRE